MSQHRLDRRRLLGSTAAATVPLVLAAGGGLPASAQDATPEDGGLVPIATAETGGGEATRSGAITIAVQSNDHQTYQALADAYTAKNPDVQVKLELKPSDGYQEFLRAQFAGGTPEVSIVNGNVVADLIQAHKFVDMSAYLDRENPYTGAAWRDSMDEVAIQNMANPVTGEIYTLNLETVQVLWFYNKTAFEKAGILAEAEELAKSDTNQPTWTQFLDWCDKLTAAGYIPVAIEGDYASFWEQSVSGPEFAALYENFKQFSDRAAPPGWLGTSDAYPLFLTSKAAIRLDVAALLGNFERDLKNLSEGKYISSAGGREDTPATPLPSQDVETFEIGSFNNPSMEGDHVDAPARTIEVNIGFLSVPKKDQAQNDLEMDFLMFLTSPEGFGVYLQNRLDPNNAGSAGVNGPPIVKDVSLPGDLASKFAQLKLIGNTEKDTAGGYRARGISDYQPSVREWVDLAQQYFAGDIGLQEFLDGYQASVDRLFPEILTHLQLTDDDLAHPEKKPASQV